MSCYSIVKSCYFRYFLNDKPDESLADEEAVAYSDEGARLLAFNGWVMHDDVMQNFAQLPSMVYKHLHIYNDF